MDILFFAALILYFAATVIQLCGIALGKNAWCRIARWTLLGAFVLHTAFTVSLFSRCLRALLTCERRLRSFSAAFARNSLKW